MKKIILISLFMLGIFQSISAHASAVAESCGNFGSSAGSCAKCFRETDYIYGCNQYQSCSQYYGLNYLSDTMINTGTITKIMYSSPTDKAGKVEFLRLQTQTDWSLSSNDMFRVPSTFSPLYTGMSGIYYMLNGGASVKWIESKPGEFIRLNSVSSGASRSQPAYKITFVPKTYDLISQGNLGPAVNHRQCLFIYPRFCGDGIKDTDRGEQCDDGNMNSGDGCSNTCQTEVTPICNNLTIAPTSVTNGGTVTYTCSGTNATSYSIIARNPDGTILTSSTSAAGSLTIPVTPTGNYTVSCFINGQVSTPTACQKTVTNTTITEPICTNLSVTPTSVTNGGIVTYTCNGNNVTNYSVVFSKPDGTVLQSFSTQGGSVTIPATPTGAYTAKCYINGQTTTPIACQKTVTNTTVDQPVCTGLTLTPQTLTNGGNVTYSCTGNNTTSYSVVFTRPDGSIIQSYSSPTGAITIPATPTGIYTARCYVNGQTSTPSECIKSVTVTPNQTNPQIQVVKDDNDNHDDSQFLQDGGLAQFTVVVRNPGPESIDNVTLSDALMPECNRNTNETQNMIINVGNRDARLDPGESFSYVCTRANVNQGMFPNNENRVCVYGRGITSGINVNSCDSTRIGFGTTSSVCQNIQVSQNGGQTNVICSPTGGYRLYVLQGKQVINTLQNPNGQFSFGLNDGTYKVVCLRDGEQTVQPSCQKTVTVNPQQDYCTLNSSVSYGGAPLRTQLSCSSQTYAQCAIRIMKDGKPWRSVADCNADIIFTEKGVYDATCIIGDLDTQSCSTRVQVDIMTIIRTGPFLPIVIVFTLAIGGYITYRRRKTA